MAPATRPPARSSKQLIGLAVILVVGGVIGLVRKVGDLVPDPAPNPGAAAQGGASAQRQRPAELSPDELCPSAGYLCIALDRTGIIRVRRWLDGRDRLVVYVPPVPVDDPRARDVREAVIRGIMAWNDHPFPISVQRQPGRDADFSVRWSGYLTGANRRYGFERWNVEEGLRFESLEMAYRSNEGGGMRTRREAEAGAAQEMGHALGLEWSDSDRDVMYPGNTATTRPSARDYETVAALYTLPNGATIRR